MWWLIKPDCFSYRGCAELVKSTIFPSTANEVDKQYVCVTLEALLPEGYPDCKPLINLKSPRGLDDSIIDHLYREIEKKCEEYMGQAVIYELIEVGKKLIFYNLTKSVGWFTIPLDFTLWCTVVKLTVKV